METGKLNDRIRIYEPKAGMNLTSLDDYELAGSVWANVRAVTTRDQIHSGIDVQSGQLVTVQIIPLWACLVWTLWFWPFILTNLQGNYLILHSRNIPHTCRRAHSRDSCLPMAPRENR